MVLEVNISTTTLVDSLWNTTTTLAQREYSTGDNTNVTIITTSSRSKQYIINSSQPSEGIGGTTPTTTADYNGYKVATPILAAFLGIALIVIFLLLYLMRRNFLPRPNQDLESMRSANNHYSPSPMNGAVNAVSEKEEMKLSEIQPQTTPAAAGGVQDRKTSDPTGMTTSNKNVGTKTTRSNTTSGARLEPFREGPPDKSRLSGSSRQKSAEPSVIEENPDDELYEGEDIVDERNTQWETERNEEVYENFDRPFKTPDRKPSPLLTTTTTTDQGNYVAMGGNSKRAPPRPDIEDGSQEVYDEVNDNINARQNRAASDTACNQETYDDVNGNISDGSETASRSGIYDTEGAYDSPAEEVTYDDPVDEVEYMNHDNLRAMGQGQSDLNAEEETYEVPLNHY